MTMCEKLGFKSVVRYKGVSMNVDMDAVVEGAERQIKKQHDRDVELSKGTGIVDPYSHYSDEMMYQLAYEAITWKMLSAEAKRQFDATGEYDYIDALEPMSMEKEDAIIKALRNLRKQYVMYELNRDTPEHEQNYFEYKARHNHLCELRKPFVMRKDPNWMYKLGPLPEEEK